MKKETNGFKQVVGVITNSRRYFYSTLFALTALLLLVHCSPSPEITFPNRDLYARVSGSVSPIGHAGTAYIMDADIIDSVAVDPADGSFVFDSVVYGTYRLKIAVEGFGTYSMEIYVNSRVEYLGQYSLSTFPSPILSITPIKGTVIDSTFIAHRSNTYFTDTTAVIRFAFESCMDSASILSAISVKPSMPFSLQWDYSSGCPYNVNIIFPQVDFFSTDTLALHLAASAKTLYGQEGMDFAYDYVCFPDTAYRSKAIFSTYVYSSSPQADRPGTFVTPPSSIVIVFQRMMNTASVEKAFSITPYAAPNFFWDYDSYNGTRPELTVRFTEPLTHGMKYTVAIDTTAKTMNGATLPGPVTFWFLTRQMFLENYSPLDGATSVGVDAPFVYTANFSFDTASLRSCFSITPAVDSLWFVSSSYQVKVYHTPLIPDTSYTIVIDSALKSVEGGRYGSIIKQRFHTDTVASTWLGLSKISSVTPSDTLYPVPVSTSVLICFGEKMNMASLEGKIALLPETPCRFEWSESGYSTSSKSNLRVIPIQPLQTNTVYQVIIDSGYADINGFAGNGGTYRFKTERLQILSTSPYLGQVNVDRNAPLIFRFNTSIDTSVFKAQCIIAPAIDSLRLEKGETGVSGVVEWKMLHAAFLADTEYLVLVGPGITDAYGKTMQGTGLNIRFSTGK